jgi:hypothetical protein
LDAAGKNQENVPSVAEGSYHHFEPEKPCLPQSTIQTLNDRSVFYSDVLCIQSRFSHLLDESIFNLGFVYEEGDNDFRKDDANGRLRNLGKLNLQSWESCISAVHFMFPSEKQATNARTAKCPHCQATFREFIQAMQKYCGPDIRFVFYTPNCNHSTNFLFAPNREAAHQYTLAINLEKIKKQILLNCHSAISNSTLWEASGNCANYVFCTSQNSIEMKASLVTLCRS